MSDSQGDSGPPLLRPIPRRPFDLHLREPTPPEDDTLYDPPLLNLESLNSRLLDPRDNNGPNTPSESTSISRASSALNLTGSTLMGIYSPSTYGKDRFSDMTPPTPWNNGAETPVQELVLDDYLRIHEIQKERAQPSEARRRRSSLHPILKPHPMSAAQRVFHFGSRGLLLFGLGMLYGMMVAHLRDKGRVQMEDMIKTADGGYDWRYMAFWGISGVAMGCLLPWFDGIWERAFGYDDESIEELSEAEENAKKDPASCTDWALAVRGIGALVGIAFAIRKLPWDSTLQVSLTLALVNPVLWFLIDRSVPGFLLSAVVGIFGSAILMGLQPEMVPTPTNPSGSGFLGYGWEYGINATAGGSGLVQPQKEFVLFGGHLTVGQETVATGIWMMSVLFCCCVCFGNIGRWLALNRSAAARGRWAERR
ncbi:insulin-induced protein-domain-containing protein [Hypoxylon cercidicola]|nr:insulin-induced protein-domain-containing protein [Hypoxylon cercidicola]